MTSLTNTELAIPALREVVDNEHSHSKGEVVISEDLNLSQGQIAVATTIAGSVAAVMSFSFTGNNIDLLPMVSAIGALSAGFGNTLWRWFEIEEGGPKKLKLNFTKTLPSFSRKAKRIPVASFGVHDPDANCMKYWVYRSQACAKGQETHFITHYAVKKGLKVYREQEVSYTLESLWDSSLDAIEEYYSPNSRH